MQAVSWQAWWPADRRRHHDQKVRQERERDRGKREKERERERNRPRPPPPLTPTSYPASAHAIGICLIASMDGPRLLIALTELVVNPDIANMHCNLTILNHIDLRTAVFSFLVNASSAIFLLVSLHMHCNASSALGMGQGLL